MPSQPGIARARRRLLAARRLARSPGAPPTERRAAERTVRRLLRRYPALAQEPEEVARHVELRRRLPEEMERAARHLVDVDGRASWKLLAACSRVAAERGIDPLVMDEAVYQAAQLVEATRRGDMDRDVERKRRAGEGFTMGPVFDPFAAPPEEEQAGGVRALPPGDEPLVKAGAGGGARDEAPPPLDKPLFLADPWDMRTRDKRERSARPHGAHPGWPSSRREPPWDPSWWDADARRWRAPDWRMPRDVAPWVPRIVWELVVALEKLYARPRLTREPLLLGCER